MAFHDSHRARQVQAAHVGVRRFLKGQQRDAIKDPREPGVVCEESSLSIRRWAGEMKQPHRETHLKPTSGSKRRSWLATPHEMKVIPSACPVLDPCSIPTPTETSRVD